MYFATILDKNYITRAQVMYDSLFNTAKENLTLLFVFCLDDLVFEYFENKDKIQVIKLRELELYFPNLKIAKTTRSYVEYIFTLSPFLPLYILKKFEYVNRITSIDADLYFLSNPNIVIDRLQSFEIAITPHSFPNELMHLENHGKYNVSFQSFPRTENGIACLSYWAKSCIDFCGDEIDEFGRYADQKYLDNWFNMFDHVIDFPFPQIGLAPWNIKKLNLKNDIFSKGNVVFYHFHDFKIRSKFHSIIGLENYNLTNISYIILKLYITYWKKLRLFGHVTDNSFKRHSDNINKHLFLRDIKNKPILFRFLHSGIYIDFRNVINPFYIIMKKLYVKIIKS